MKIATFLLVGSIILTGCSSSTNSVSAGTGRFLCIPDSHAVTIPLSGGSDSGFDPEGGGYGTSILIQAEEVVRLIPGFKTEIGVGSNVRYQSLYVMLSPRSEVERDSLILPAVQTLEASESLARVETDAFNWPVVEQTESGPIHWGSCADRFTRPESFTCMRDLLVGDLVMTYPIHQQNLHLYMDIDSMLMDKVKEWRCPSGKISIER